MVWTFHPLGTLPTIGSIVWCRFPMGGNPNIPGGDHHPVLVLGRNIDIDKREGRLIVAYGTSTIKEASRGKIDLIITQDEIAAHNLRYPTRFDLALVNKLDLPWATEWFSVPRSQQELVISQISDAVMTRLKALIAWRRANNFTD